jgi:hypothetical protein
MSPNTNQTIQRKAQVAALFVVITGSIIQIVSAVTNLATLYSNPK